MSMLRILGPLAIFSCPLSGGPTAGPAPRRSSTGRFWCSTSSRSAYAPGGSHPAGRRRRHPAAAVSPPACRGRVDCTWLLPWRVHGSFVPRRPQWQAGPTGTSSAHLPGYQPTSVSLMWVSMACLASASSSAFVFFLALGGTSLPLLARRRGCRLPPVGVPATAGGAFVEGDLEPKPSLHSPCSLSIR